MSQLVNNYQETDHFQLIKRLLKICGISLREKETFSFKIYSVFVLTIHLYPLFQFIGVFRYLENGAEVFEFSIFEAVTFLILVKTTVMVYKRLFMGQLLEKLQSGVFLPNIERGGIEEDRLMKDCVTLTDRQAIVYWTVVTVTVILAVFDAGYSRIRSNDYHDWKFEYGRVTMFNTSYSPNYEIASFYQNFSWFPIGWSFANSDLLTVTVLAHLTCQLKILQNSIRKIMSNSYRKMLKDQGIHSPIPEEFEIDASKVPWKYIKPTMQEVVEYHLSIIGIAEKIEYTFNLLVLLIMLSGIVLLGSLLYRLEVVHVGGAMCIMCEIILICFWGNEVALESEKVLQACYEVNFYGADRRFQKGLFLIMERSRRPIRFTAGKFTPLTLGTFLWIARTSYSYLMILRRMNSS